jgi:hypothetical protein
VQRGHQRDGEQHAHETEERAHDEQREHHDRRVEGDRLAHHEGINQVGLDHLDARIGQNHPEGVYGRADQRQEHRRNHRDRRSDKRYEGDETAEDPEQQRERYPDQGQRQGGETADDGHGRELS